jgi:hypothetical protein
MIMRGSCARRVAGVLLAASVAGEPTSASPISDLPGRWSGWGSITMSNGQSEQLKCVATYFVGHGGASLQQNLRCASTSYKIDATASLEVNNGQVSGEWHEKIYSADGSVAGRITGNGFSLSIQGENFNAAMSVTTSTCKQSVSIAPRGFGISKISMNLGKC